MCIIVLVDKQVESFWMLPLLQVSGIELLRHLTFVFSICVYSRDSDSQALMEIVCGTFFALSLSTHSIKEMISPIWVYKWTMTYQILTISQ